MPLSLRIAIRYLFSKKSHRAVNIISAIAVAGVGVATAAIVIVLSVFNGFNRISTGQLSLLNPAVKVMPAKGMTFAGADSIAGEIMKIGGVESAVPVIEQRAMLHSADELSAVRFKAVGENYDAVVGIGEAIIDGVLTQSVDSMPAVVIAVGVANRMWLRPGPQSVAEIYMPRRTGRVNVGNPMSAFKKRNMVVCGVFSTNQSDTDDDMVIIPLALAREMLEYENGEATAIEVKTRAGVSDDELADGIGSLLGADFEVLGRNAQQADSLRMIQVEKWVTFMMLMFILLVASFNIVATLSLLVVEKRGDAEVLRSMGLGKRATRSIFAWQGFLITIFGGAAGLVAGVLLSLVQECFGIIRLAGDPSALVVSAYPVAVEITDLFAVAAALVVVGAITSLASAMFTKKIT